MAEAQRRHEADAIGNYRAALIEALGPGALIEERDRLAPYLREWRELYHGATPFVVRPSSTEEVATTVRLAARHGVALVPQGGNSGLVGGQIPTEAGDEVVISTERLTAIETVDPDGNTMTVGAGAILADVQAAADEVNRMFPVSLASEGSARIGGLIATNAGGTGVLAYGNMRAQVLGLEVVLPDGRIWDGLRALRKDNVGYDLKHLFIGSEGTLGIITRAVLRMVAKPHTIDVALAGVTSPAAAIALLAAARDAMGGAVSAFEILPRIGIEFVLEYGQGARNPFPGEVPEWIVLIEASSHSAELPMREVLEGILMRAIEAGDVGDALVSQSLGEAQDFWRLRELLSEVQSHAGGSIKHDVSVPIAAVPQFLGDAIEATLAIVPGARPVPFGHLGDGNIHFNVSQPEGADKAEFLKRWGEMNEAVHAIASRHGGSIAAEHGVGRLKRDLMPTVRSDVELDMMYAVKSALDPRGLMNPGRVLPPRG